MDIEISALLGQYMEYINAMEKQSLELASEFLEMAARLVYIKTAGLLPRHEEEAQAAKAELVGQLLEYKACREAAGMLASRSLSGYIFCRPPEDIKIERTYTGHMPPSALVRAYLDALGRGKRRLPPSPEVFSPLVAAPVVSVTSRILHILRALYKSAAVGLGQLYAGCRSRSELVASFMAVLELMKGGRVRLTEEENITLLPREGAVRRRSRTAGEV